MSWLARAVNAAFGAIFALLALGFGLATANAVQRGVEPEDVTSFGLCASVYSLCAVVALASWKLLRPACMLRWRALGWLNGGAVAVLAIPLWLSFQPPEADPLLTLMAGAALPPFLTTLLYLAIRRSRSAW